MDDYIDQVKSFKTMIFKIIAYFVITNFTIGSILYFFHIGAQKEGLFNEIAEKTHTIGSSIEVLVNRAITVGIPFTEIKGLQEYLDKKLTATEELQYIFVTDLKGNIVAQTQNAPGSLSGSLKQFALTTDALKDAMPPFNIFSYVNIPVPIIVEDQNNKAYGYLHLGVSVKAVQNKISDIFFDIAIILFVSLIIGFEFIRFTFVNYVVTPLNDFLSGISRMAKGDLSLISSIRAQTGIYQCLEKLNSLIGYYCSRITKILSEFKMISKNNYLYDLIRDNISEMKASILTPKDGKLAVAPLSPAVENLRLVVFLFLICEGIVTTISPSYAGQFYTEGFYISKQLYATLPVIVFFLLSIISFPFGFKLASKYNFRKTFLVGLSLYCFGFIIATIFPEGIEAFLVCRAFNAVGFGIVYISCQNYVGTYSSPSNRVKHYSIYLVALGAAYLTGMPVGGLLVDNIGYGYTFTLCAFITASAIIYSRKYILDYEGFDQKGLEDPIVNPFKVTKVPGLASITICLAFPARFLYGAMMTVLNPLYLVHLGNSMSIVGRVMMIYGIFVFCISPYAHKFVSLFLTPVMSTIICNSLLCISLLVQWLIPTTQGVVIALTIYSVGTVLHVSSMMAALGNLAAESEADNYHTVISAYFTYERISMLISPMISAICIAHFGYQRTLLSFASFIFITNILFILINKNKYKFFSQRG